MIRLTSHMSFNLATQARGVQQPIKKNFTKFYVSSIYEKTVNHRNSLKVAFGRLKGPLQIPKWHCIKIVNPSWHKSMICLSTQKRQIFRTAIARTPDPFKKKKKTVFQITYSYTPLPIYGSKLWNLGGSKNSTKIFGSGTFGLEAPPDAPGCCTPLKMVPSYSIGTCPPTTPRHFDTPSVLHWENIDFLQTPVFGQSTRTALESP